MVNFDLPNVPEDYIHRIGRTGRAGNSGEAVSLVCIDEAKLLKDVERLLKREIQKVIIPNFEPNPRILAEPIINGRRTIRPDDVSPQDRINPDFLIETALGIQQIQQQRLPEVHHLMLLSNIVIGIGHPLVSIEIKDHNDLIQKVK